MYTEIQSDMWSKRKKALIETHREYYSKLGTFEEQPFPDNSSDCGIRWGVCQGYGEGFSEVLHLNCGPDLGMCGYRLSSPLESSYREKGISFRFCVMLSGTFTISSADRRHSQTVRGGDLWLCSGDQDMIHCSQPADSFISGVSLEVTESMLNFWLGGATCHLSSLLERHLKAQDRQKQSFPYGSRQKARALPGDHPIMQVGKDLCMTRRNTVCGRLRFESLALEFLSQVLSLEESPARSEAGTPQRQRAVEEARGILDEEWTSPPTISSLARRVGVNECYLKTDFRERTGMSIGAYVRKLRMEQALGLIESGRCSVLQAATFVGYSNPSHFSKAFKRFHGRLPSAYLTRSQGMPS